MGDNSTAVSGLPVFAHIFRPPTLQNSEEEEEASALCREEFSFTTDIFFFLLVRLYHGS